MPGATNCSGVELGLTCVASYACTTVQYVAPGVRPVMTKVVLFPAFAVFGYEPSAVPHFTV